MSNRPQTKDASTTLPATMPAAMRSIVDIAEAIMIDLPIAATVRVLARTDERALNEAGWKAYDAIVKVANDATSRVYTNSAFGRVAASAMEFALRAQRLNAALSGAIFANLWPAIGLPAATDIAAMREEVSALRLDLAEARVAIAVAATAQPPAEPRMPRDNPRFDVESAMMSTTGVFQRPLYTGLAMPKGREIAEMEANVSN
jgi:hypothetical protein